MDLKQIDRNIKLVGSNTAKVNQLIQLTAVAIIEHCAGAGAGDCTRALRLVQAMPKSFRRGLLIKYFAKYSPIGMNVSTGKVGLHKPEAKAYNPFNIDGARANNWFEIEEAAKEDLPDTTIADVAKQLNSLSNRLQSKLDKGMVAANDREDVTTVVQALKAIAAAA